MLSDRKAVFSRIVCPVDLRLDSSAALAYAAELAACNNAELFILHCVERKSINGSRRRAQFEKSLRSTIANQMSNQALAPLRWEQVIMEGAPDIEISNAAAELGADLIVMRSRRLPYSAPLLGSVAESVSRTAPCPVLVTHTCERDWAKRDVDVGSGINLKTVLIGYDFSTDSELALSYGLWFARQYRAEAHILHVLPAPLPQMQPEIAGLPVATQSAFQKAASALTTVVLPAAATEVAIVYRVRVGQPYREVLAYAEENRIDLLCLGASGADFGMRSLFGSNVDRVLRQATCPILIARPLRPKIAALGTEM